MKFIELGLSEPLLRALATEGYVTATPIQAQAIPAILQGRDVLGSAQTGTGKTAAFALPILHRLSTVARPANSRGPRAIVLCPTRELAAQIGDSFRAYGKHTGQRHTVIYGGVGQRPQVDAMRRGVDILVATPGRLLDLINQRHVELGSVEMLVLDEADRMMDMGFIHDIRRVVALLPATRQSLLFSATMPTEIRRLAATILRNPQLVEVAKVSETAANIEQSVYYVEKRNKPELLAHLYENMAMSRVIVFTRTKHGADRVVRHLHTHGIKAEAIHGNKSQNARNRALGNFKNDKTAVLVATDVASRGIDVDGITHVINYDISDEPEAYVHRIGRTARAGASGVAVAFCDKEEVSNLKAIERLIRKQIPVKNDHPVYSERPAAGSSDRPSRDRDREPRQHASQGGGYGSRGAGPSSYGSGHSSRGAGHSNGVGHPRGNSHAPRANGHAPRGTGHTSHQHASPAANRPGKPAAAPQRQGQGVTRGRPAHPFPGGKPVFRGGRTQRKAF